MMNSFTFLSVIRQHVPRQPHTFSFQLLGPVSEHEGAKDHVRLHAEDEVVEGDFFGIARLGRLAVGFGARGGGVGTVGVSAGLVTVAAVAASLVGEDGVAGSSSVL